MPARFFAGRSGAKALEKQTTSCPILFTAAYDGALAYLDSQVGNLLEALKSRGQLDRTLVILVSDHGEALADQGFYIHGHSLYMDQIHVPLIIRLPGRIPAGLPVSAPVSIADIPATVSATQGIPEPGALPGTSLTRFWKSPSMTRSVTPIVSEVGHRDGVPKSWQISTGRVRSLVSGDWHLIDREQAGVELYRLRKDPRELTNLADSLERRAVVANLKRELERTIDTLRPVSPGHPYGSMRLGQARGLRDTFAALPGESRP